MNRIVIAGVTSSVGKTTIATGIIGALARMGLKVQPFKCGPDYIDPSYHQWAAGVPSRNLDSWMLAEDALRELFMRACQGMDVAVVEGVMGLYDGRYGEGEVGSTAHIAKLLDAPVILVVDVSKTARSAAATVLGFQKFDPQLRLSGVILNNVGSSRHKLMVTEAIKETTGLAVLGAVLRKDALKLPERHLGLIPVIEGPVAHEALQRVARDVSESCNIVDILSIAQSATPMPDVRPKVFPQRALPRRVPLAVAQDEAFSFYYQDNLDLLAAWGADLLPFSPIRDRELPKGVGGIYIGGGFPELYAPQLAANEEIRQAIYEAAQKGMPIYGECGGLMYLAQGITDFDGKAHKMVGIVPGWCIMSRKKMSLDYVEVKAQQDNVLMKNRETVRGHEFHWSDIKTSTDTAGAYEIISQGSRKEGFARRNVLASYIHLHFGAKPSLAQNFVEACRCFLSRKLL